MGRRRRGPTPKAGTRRAGSVVHELDAEQWAEVLAAFDAEDQGDDCAICRAAGIRVLEDGAVVDR